MRFAQEQYLRQCYGEYTAALRQCRHCGPSVDPVKKRWDDAVASVAAYVNTIAVSKGFPTVRIGRDGDVMSWGHTWDGGVFEGDSSDGGPRQWYWRVTRDDVVQWANTPVDALIAWVIALELHVEADPAARSLQFIVRMPDVSCHGDDHAWVFVREGRHGSDKGDMVYECRVCKKSKVQRGV